MKHSATVFALTGGIGSGKSTVAGFLREAGIPVVDADQLARRVTEPGSPALKQLVASFGPDILTQDGKLRRKALADRVFSSTEARAALEAIIHPEVRRLSNEAFARLAAEGHEFICYEIPLLFETEQQQRFRPVVVSYVPEVAQLARTMRRDGATEQEAQARIDAQLDLGFKAEQADYVIDNSGSVGETRAQTMNVLAKIRTG